MWTLSIVISHIFTIDSDAGLFDGFLKTGVFPYIPPDGKSEILVSREFNADTSRSAPNSVPCRAIDKVSPDLREFCKSVVDPMRPGWYVIHREDGSAVFEPEYALTNLDTFDDDASLLQRKDFFFPGFDSFEAFSRPNHFYRATPDGKFVMSEFENTTEFRNSASMWIIRRGIKGKFTSYLTIYRQFFSPFSLSLFLFLCVCVFLYAIDS